MARAKPSKSGQGRISAKISHLVRSGEVPNTAKGRKQAAGMAYGMERSGRLGPKGGYKKAKSK